MRRLTLEIIGVILLPIVMCIFAVVLSTWISV